VSQVAATVPIQGLGRELVQNLFVALRSAQLYDPRNDTLRAAAERFARTLEELQLVDHCARLEVGGDLILVKSSGTTRGFTSVFLPILQVVAVAINIVTIANR